MPGIFYNVTEEYFAMNYRKRIHIIFVIAACVSWISCSKQNLAQKVTYQIHSSDGKPDYANLSYWAAHPWKWDPSDSVPFPLRNKYVKDSLADVFFLYPTSFTNIVSADWNASIDDADLNAKTDYTSILYQASAFAEETRVFAPRYRQANLKAYFSKDTAKSEKAFDIAYQDIRTAFLYYLEHYNNGRPIIIASHSQGTTHAGRLLKEFFEDKPLQNKLVCAYLIGMPIPDHYFGKLTPCSDSTATGCFVGWRTYEKGYTDPIYIAKETFKSIVVNPLTWTIDQTYAPAPLNKGGVLKNFNKIIPGLVDAQVHENILWSSKPKFFGNVFLRLKNYHIADINFFYINISENVKTRIRVYLKPDKNKTTYVL